MLRLAQIVSTVRREDPSIQAEAEGAVRHAFAIRADVFVLLHPHSIPRLGSG